MMLTRVSILLLVTGLFAGMWSADSPDGRTANEIQLARRGMSPRANARSVTAGRNTRKLTVNEVSKTAGVPLPQGIAPGEYLVVNQTGVSQRLAIPATQGVTTNNARSVDHYTVRDGANRWHFIRLETSAQNSIPPMTSANGATPR